MDYAGYALHPHKSKTVSVDFGLRASGDTSGCFTEVEFEALVLPNSLGSFAKIVPRRSRRIELFPHPRPHASHHLIQIAQAKLEKAQKANRFTICNFTLGNRYYTLFETPRYYPLTGNAFFCETQN